MRDLEKSEIETLKMQPLKNGRPTTYRVADRLYATITAPGGNNPKLAAGSWLMRYSHGGKPHWLGLGAFGRLTFQDAKRLVYKAGLALADGKDPLTMKRDSMTASVAAQALLRTFRACWHEYCEAGHLKALAPRTRAGWLQHADAYVLPVLGRLAVAGISTADVGRVLADHWYAQPATGRYLRMEIEAVMNFAAVAGYRDGTAPNPAGLDRIKALFPNGAQPTKAARPHVMIAPAEMPAFMKALREINGPVARCLETLCLTASRKSEIAGLTWGEIDMINGLITVSPDRMKMKGRAAHVIPMSPRVATILAGMTAGAAGDRVWPRSVSGGRALLELLHKLTKVEIGGPDLHGTARATFSTWANDTAAAPSHVIEACLAHVKKDAVKGAYDRALHIEARRALLTKYAEFCAG